MKLVRCTECGELVDKDTLVWEEYVLMDTDEVIGKLPVCEECAKLGYDE